MAIVTLILAAAIFTGFLYLIPYFSSKLRQYQTAKSLPGPRALPIIGNALTLIGETSDKFKKILELTEIYPSLFRLWLGPILVIVIYDPVHVKAVCASPNAMQKSDDYESMKPGIGEGLFTAPESKWRVNRKFLSQAFHLNGLKTFLNTSVKHINVLVQKLESKNVEEVDIYNFALLCTLDIVYETLLDIPLSLQTDPDCKLPSCMDSIMKAGTQRIFNIWIYLDTKFYNISIGKEQQKCLAYLNTFTDKVIRKKKSTLEANLNKESSPNGKESEKNPKMFIDYVMELITEKDIRDEVNTITFTGSDTTARTVSFVFLMLATFPEVQDKIYQELYEIYGSSDPLETPIKYDHLQHMNYLERVIKETMRLFPAAPIIARQTMEDLKVHDDVTIPKGSKVLIPIYKLHRLEKYWPEPLKFDPDRFLPENVEARQPFCYIPFSGGPRNCIAGKYAAAEIKTIIATILRKFIVKVDKPMAIKDIEIKFHITMKPVKPIMLRFQKRH